MILNKDSRIAYTPAYLVLDGEPWFPMMGEIHYSRVESARWEEELYKMKAGGIDLVSCYTIWIHHEEVEGEWDFTGDRNLRAFLETISRCGMHCVLRIGPWAHGEVRNGGFPDWLMDKERAGELHTRTNDPVYLGYVRQFYEQIAAQARGMLLADGGPIAMIQIENEYGHCGGQTGEAGEAHMRTLREMAQEVGLVTQIYTATGWGGAVTGGMLPVMGGYCEAPWDQRTTEIEPSGNYLFTKERNDHNIGSDHGLGVGITFDMDAFPYLTAELGGGLQVTSHRRPIATGKDTEAMTLVKLGSGCNLLGYYMYHGGTNPEGRRTTLQESRETGYPNDLPVKSYDFNAPIREYGQLTDAYRRIRRLALFIHDFGQDLAQMPYIPQPGNPDRVDDLTSLRTAVRYNEETGTGYYFVNNYVRHYSMAEHPDAALEAYAADGVTVLADLGVQDIHDGDCYFYPFHMPIGEHSILEQTNTTPLCILHDAEGRPDAWAFYAQDVDAADYAIPGEEGGLTLLTLSEEESLHAQKVVLDGREFLAISEGDVYQTVEGEIHLIQRVGREAVEPAISLYPHTAQSMRVEDAGADAMLENPVRCTMSESRYSEETGDLTAHIHVDGITADLDEAFLILHYAGASAELYHDGRLVADNFYTGQPWEIGLTRIAAGQESLDLDVVIHPLHAGDPIYLYEWPEMERGIACRILGAETAAVYNVVIA